ncbi:MAG: ABC transporter substrate-binding protein [Deltaproteobacteria bacterium]|nr:ABC transporter substrate-binding protein [Deltaproteobacteria bacterium]
MSRRYGASLILSLVMLLLACGLSQARQITDMAGRKVQVPEVIKRVYATAPPATYMIYAVAPDLLVGTNGLLPKADPQYINPHVRGLPVLGGWFGQGRMANLEALLQAKPDVVVAFRWRNLTTQWKIEQTLEPMGLPVASLIMTGTKDFPQVFRFLGQLLDRNQRAKILAAYGEHTLADLARLRDSLPPAQRLRVYYAEGGKGLQTECSDSFHTELIPLCGAVNVHKCMAKTIYGMDKVSLEQVLAYDPQVILTHNHMFYKAVREDPRWRKVRAVAQGRVYKIPSVPFNWFDRPPSFMRLLGAQWLANKLYPAKYPVDMVAKTMEFYRLFLSVEVDRATAAKLLGR